MLWVSLLLALSANGLGAECATRVCASRPLLQRHGFTPAPSITAQRRARPRSRSLRPRRPRPARLCPPPPPAGGLLSPRVLAGAEPAWRPAGASSVPRPGEQRSSRKTLVPGTNPRTFLTETLPLAQRPFLSAPRRRRVTARRLLRQQSRNPRFSSLPGTCGAVPASL